MTNIIEKIENEQTAKKEHPEIQPGYTVVLGIKITEGSKTRVQNFEGTVIALTNRKLRSSITVRKVSHDVAVERVFPLYAPCIESIKVTRKGKVRRAKLYYLRDVSGKKSRLKEIR
jgi:large subunit ribosomal protein L19